MTTQLSSSSIHSDIDTRPFWVGVSTLIILLLAAIGFVIMQGSQIPLRARLLLPEPESVVGVKPNIRVTFARPVDKATVEGKVSMTPEVPFEISWANNELRIIPQEYLTAEREYQVTIGPGVSDNTGGELKGELTWQFSTRQPLIAFTRFADDMSGELWLNDMNGNELKRLAALGQNVLDYDVSPDGSYVVYTVEEDFNTVNLWRSSIDWTAFNRLTEDQKVIYGAPRFSPSGDLLAVEVREEVQIGGQGSQLSPPRLEFRRPTDGTPAGLIYGGEGDMGHSPRWSPDGTRIAFIESNLNAIGIFNFTSDIRTIPAESALIDSQGWTLNSRGLLYTIVTFTPQHAQQTLMLRDLEMGTEISLGEELGDQAGGAWSPDGSLIAYAYKPPPGLDFGSGIWLMRSDGTGRIPLVTEPEVIYSAPLWSPDGEWVLFGQFDLKDPESTQTLWIIRHDGSDLRQVSDEGFQFKWVP